jgi:hypothetical protein
MPVERRGRSRPLGLGQRETGGTHGLDGRRQPSLGWHEPDESRGSRPDQWETRDEIPGPTRQFPGPTRPGLSDLRTIRYPVMRSQDHWSAVPRFEPRASACQSEILISPLKSALSDGCGLPQHQTSAAHQTWDARPMLGSRVVFKGSLPKAPRPDSGSRCAGRFLHIALRHHEVHAAFGNSSSTTCPLFIARLPPPEAFSVGPVCHLPLGLAGPLYPARPPGQ